VAWPPASVSATASRFSAAGREPDQPFDGQSRWARSRL
jgi:hypothetical protein